MRVLLDECLPRKLKQEIPGHDVHTVPEAGWAGKQNGELIRIAAERFDVFVTIDANLPAQQNLSRLAVAVVILAAADNRFPTLQPLMAQLPELLPTLKPGQVVRLGA